VKYALHYTQFRRPTGPERDRLAHQLLGQFDTWLPWEEQARVGLRGLDVGAGSCIGLRALQLAGFEASGVECDPTLASLARAEGFRITENCRPIEYLLQSPGAFAAIVMRDVLEHFTPEDAESLITAASEALLPGGVLVLTTPNAFSPIASVMRYIDFTHHFSSTPFSIRPMLQSNGFAEVHIAPTQWGFMQTGGKALWRRASRQALARWAVRRLWSGLVWAEYGVSPRREGIPIDPNITVLARTPLAS